MFLGIATVVVLVLLAVLVLPSKKRDADTKQTSNTILPFQSPERSQNLREQQVQEEAEAIASEYQRRADEAWLEELSVKASALLKSPAKATRKA
ncbi:hypothetical protein [Planctomycetes bacterium TBK1r]|uniref:Uncharacterized protein n=1 Tax=Stieleria magnilauensis TaxID=2527963 RepID=A0ABX5XTX0_9BACT|nr:hypothetical protein TBK1r_44870 [Planctomycetes bacterium TBK1r]